MKILYLNPVSFIGGGEVSLSTLLKFLDKNRFAPIVILPGHGPLEERFSRNGVRVKIMSWGNITNLLSRKNLLSLFIFPFVLPHIFILLIRLKSIIKREEISLIHTNGLKSHFLGALLGPLTGVKVVWHMREIYPLWIKIPLKFFGKFISVNIIAISRAVKDAMGSNSTVIYNGVDRGLFYPFSSPLRNLKEELGLKKEAHIITMPGVLTPWKGQRIFLKAISELKGRFPELIGLIAGEELYTGIGHRGYMGYLKEMAEKLGIENEVRFLGYRKDMPYIINSSLAIVHASLKPEPFGRVIIEAMACGKPVIATRGGAVEEIITHGVNGLIVEKGNSFGLAQAIATLIENDDMALAMGEKGRKRVEELFSAEKMARKVEELYCSVTCPSL